MNDLISRQAAIMHFVKAAKKYECGMFDLEEATHELWKVPSAEQERKKGKWIKTRHGYLNGMPVYKCSNCTNFRLSREDGDMVEHYYFTAQFPYCPCCGAKMEQEERK